MKNNRYGIIANDDLCNYFSASVKSGSLSHAYILLGDKGTGKRTLARLVAAALNCEQKKEDGIIPCAECSSCKKILSDNSADVITVRREADKVHLGVDPIRFIRDDVFYQPNDGDYKVYIIEDAHTMTAQAQNALLLTLEEPPQYVVFLLLCENTETILETIKSRAPILRMKTPKKEEAIEYLKQNHPSAKTYINNSPEEFDQIYIASKGSIGRVLELISSSGKKQILQIRELTTKLIGALAHNTLSRDFGEIFADFSQKRDERERIIAQLLEIEAAARDLIVLKKSDCPAMLFFTDISYAEELSYCFSAARLTGIIKSSETARIALLRNANIKLTLTEFLSSLI